MIVLSFTSERTQKSISASPDSTRRSSISNNVEAESQLASLRTKFTAQNTEMIDLKAQLGNTKAQLLQQDQVRLQYETQLAALKEEVRKERERYGTLEKEHEDLLICLAEQDEEMTNLKAQLLGVGITHA